MATSQSIFIVMGVSGCGKTTMARLLARATGGTWLDADDFHTAESKAKMAAGIPLKDEDRWPWLDLLNRKLLAEDESHMPVFLACSTLKQKYRDRLIAGLPQARFIYLKGSFELIRSRLAGRKNHFMPAELLESQFADLEEPRDAVVLDISKTDEELLNDFARMAGMSDRLPKHH
jgi:carbohydrate kinase (thermoresistant glucokinase family)